MTNKIWTKEEVISELQRRYKQLSDAEEKACKNGQRVEQHRLRAVMWEMEFCLGLVANMRDDK